MIILMEFVKTLMFLAPTTTDEVRLIPLLCVMFYHSCKCWKFARVYDSSRVFISRVSRSMTVRTRSTPTMRCGLLPLVSTNFCWMTRQLSSLCTLTTRPSEFNPQSSDGRQCRETVGYWPTLTTPTRFPSQSNCHMGTTPYLSTLTKPLSGYNPLFLHIDHTSRWVQQATELN